MIYVIVVFQLLMMFLKLFSGPNRFDTTVFILFSMIWISLLLLAEVSPLGGYQMSETAVSMCGLFLLFFDIGYVVLGASQRKINKGIQRENVVEQYKRIFLSNGLIRFFLMIFALILFVFALRYFNVVFQGDFINARNARFYVGKVFKSTLELLFYNYIVCAASFFWAFIIAFSIVFGAYKNRVFFWSVLDYVLYSFIGSGRLSLVVLLVEMMLLALAKRCYLKERLTLKKIKNAVAIFFVIIFGMFGMAYMTAVRRGVTHFGVEALVEALQVLWDQIKEYNIGPFSALSYMYDSGKMYNHLYMGKAVLLNGVDEFLSYFLGIFGINFECSKTVLGVIANATIYFGSASFNALYTCIYWFFSDFGYIGIALFSTIFGFTERKVIRKFDKDPDIFSLMIMIHVLYFLFVAHMVWQINNVDSLAYIGVIMILKKKIRTKYA